MANLMDIGVYGARSIPSTYSGYETFLTTLLPDLASKGHRVTMYCRATDTTQAGPYQGVQRVVLPAVRGKQFNTLSHGAIAGLRARMAGHQVVLVVNVANALFCAASRWSGQRVVLNTDGQEWLRGKWGALARAYFKVSARMAKYTATALVSDCAAMASVYEREFGAASTVIPYSFPPVSADADSQALQRFGVQAGDYYVIAGRLNPENNIAQVAAAYAAGGFTRPLLVLGAANYDSPVKHRLDALARSCPLIRPVGHVGHRGDFLKLIGSAAAYLHGHSVGGMNPSLVEAMYAGALVVALATPFNLETVGEAGLFFRLEEDDLARVLREVEALQADEEKSLRAAAKNRVEERFGRHQVTAAYEELLATTLVKPRLASVSIPTRWREG